MIKKALLLLILIITLASEGQSQSCGTIIPPDFFSSRKMRAMAVTTDPSYEIPHHLLPHVNLSISVYITGSGLDGGVLDSALDSLNSTFSNIGISFSACTIITLDNGEFSSINSLTNEKRLTSLHSKINTINLYLADSVISNGEMVCGYAYLPSNPALDFIFVDKKCNITSTLIHEMGHFFGLLHTHETKTGYELVNGSNCSVAGDFLCDTEASPNLFGEVGNNCEYQTRYRDANGDYYLPTVSNHMSYSNDACRCKFSQGQYKRMVDFYWSHKTHLH